jgi:hypothetical protein
MTISESDLDLKPGRVIAMPDPPRRPSEEWERAAFGEVVRVLDARATEIDHAQQRKLYAWLLTHIAERVKLLDAARAGGNERG